MGCAENTRRRCTVIEVAEKPVYAKEKYYAEKGILRLYTEREREREITIQNNIKIYFEQIAKTYFKLRLFHRLI